MTEPNVVFIDTECLGLDADVHPVWEVGLILPDGEEHLFQIKVTPRELSLAHPIALQIGRFEERYDDGEALYREQAARRVAMLIPKGAHLAGAVVSFDEERLRRLLWACGEEVPWHYHTVDVETLAVGYLAGVEFGEKVAPPWASENLSRAVNVDPDQFDRHTALGDAKWARAIWCAVMGKAGE